MCGLVALCDIAEWRNLLWFIKKAGGQQTASELERGKSAKAQQNLGYANTLKCSDSERHHQQQQQT